MIFTAISFAFVAALHATPVATADEKDAKRLEPRAMKASSFLKNGWNAAEQNYLAPYAADDDDKTAWVEGADGDGVGEWLEWQGPKLASAHKYVVFVKNGYQKSRDLFVANGRPSRVSVQLYADSVAIGPAVDVGLDTDKLGWQRFEIAVPQGQPSSSLRFTLADVAKGKAYADTCITDVRVFVVADDKYNVAAESLAHDFIRHFAAERAQAAKELATKGARPLPRLVRDDGAKLTDIKMPDVGVQPSSAWRRVGAQTPAGARAQAEALLQSDGGASGLATVFPFLARDGVTFFDEADPTTSLRKQLDDALAREVKDRAVFVKKCERDRKATGATGDSEGEHCTCEAEFEGCPVYSLELASSALKMRIAAAEKSGVFLSPGSDLIHPSEIVVADAQYRGGRDPYIVETRCDVRYGADDNVAIACTTANGPGAGDTTAIWVKRAKGVITDVFVGTPGGAASERWMPATTTASR